jgi:hypothetical protein
MCCKDKPIAAYTPKVESNAGAAVWSAVRLPGRVFPSTCATGAISGTPTAERGGYEFEVYVKNDLVKVNYLPSSPPLLYNVRDQGQSDG